MSTLGKLSDNELVVLLNKGDENAFLEIYHRYKGQLAFNLIRILKSPDLVEEVLQDLFLMLWEKRRDIDPTQAVGGYLYRAALNRTKNIFRQLAYDHRMRDEVLRTLMNAEGERTDAWIEAKEAKSFVNTLLNRLPPQQRKVYILCKLEGLSYKEVSSRLQISETTVNSHIRNANKFLRGELRRQVALGSIGYLGVLTLLF